MKWISNVSQLLCCFLICLVGLLPVQSQALTIGEERMIGERLLYSVRGEFPVLDDPDIHQYINDLGQRVLSLTGPRNFEYHFFVVLSPQFNAFAAPAGLVFFYTGLIETMKNEDELLSVLAHEIGHVVSRHIAQRSDKSGKLTAATMALALASLALGVPALSQGIFTGSLAAGQALQLQFSRNDEEQADRLSFEWMQAMQRNPVAMEGMLKTMRRITRYRSGKLPQYLLTHPDPEARLGYVQSLVAMDERQNTPDSYEKTDNFSFLRFKYRVMQESMEPEKLRMYCANTVASGKSVEQRTMAQYGLALLDAREHNYQSALRNLAKVREQYPDEYILGIDEAVIHLENRQYGNARDLLNKVIKTYPEDVYALYQLAKTEQSMGNLERAESLLLKVQKSLPDYSQLYYELGRLHAGRKEDKISRFYLGKYYLYQGRVNQAKGYLGNAAKDEELPETMRNEAKEILERLKKLEKNT